MPRSRPSRRRGTNQQPPVSDEDHPRITSRQATTLLGPTIKQYPGPAPSPTKVPQPYLVRLARMLDWPPIRLREGSHDHALNGYHLGRGHQQQSPPHGGLHGGDGTSKAAHLHAGLPTNPPGADTQTERAEDAVVNWAVAAFASTQAVAEGGRQTRWCGRLASLVIPHGGRVSTATAALPETHTPLAAAAAAPPPPPPPPARTRPPPSPLDGAGCARLAVPPQLQAGTPCKLAKPPTGSLGGHPTATAGLVRPNHNFGMDDGGRSCGH